MVHALLVVAALLQIIAVAYGLYLLGQRKGATGAWLCLLGAMLSMLVWRVMVIWQVTPPPYFNPAIAIWGSTFMVAAMFLFGREVAARHRAEVERDALLDSERAARIEAEHASRAKDEFLATLSHELRSPLAALLGWCEVLRRSSAASIDWRRGLDVIERNARAQARLVDDLLDVTRMRSGHLHLSIQAVPLAGPLNAAIQAVRPAADAQGVRLSLQVEADGPIVRGDPDRLRQVATNLLENAIRYTPAGGDISVSLRTCEGWAELKVVDTGAGIDPDFLPHVFARFRQGDSSTTRHHGGLGLGLAIVDNLVRMHGGTVRAASAGPGCGAEFTVRIPRSPDSSAPGDSTAPSPPVIDTVDGQPLAGLRVLVVDDELDIRAATTRLLEQFGATVQALASGATIRDELVRFRPHVLILDIGMPGEDGYSLMRRIRALPAGEGGRTPAISLTAHARNEDRDRALTAGFNEHLPKPIDIPRLVATVAALVA